jgi:hypothetical protein
MKTYRFRTGTGFDGIFQYEENDYLLLHIEDPYSWTTHFLHWSEWCGFDELRTILLLGTTPDNSEISRLICYVMWSSHYDYGFDIANYREVRNQGTYHPRFNNNNPSLFQIISSTSTCIDEIRSFENITENLLELFRFIEPSNKNSLSFGHKIRELLIVTCTEIEYLFLNFLRDNGCKKNRYTTKDFIVALPLLQLNDYSVSLRMFPDYEELAPFKNWSENSPTQSLQWYDAYNKTKHDRGNNFSLANLHNLLLATSAIHIVLEAQYGKEIFDTFKSSFRRGRRTKRNINHVKEFSRTQPSECNRFSSLLRCQI